MEFSGVKGTRIVRLATDEEKPKVVSTF